MDIKVQDEFVLPEGKPDIGSLAHVSVKVEIISSSTASAPVSISYEGQALTGLRMDVRGLIEADVEYAGQDSSKSVHTIYCSKLFTASVPLGKVFNPEMEAAASAYIEDVFVKQTGSRRIYLSAVLILDAEPLINPAHFIKGSEAPALQKQLMPGKADHNELFMQSAASSTLMIPQDMPDVGSIISVITDLEIMSLRAAGTVRGVSAGGRHLTGRRIYAEIRLRHKILYSADSGRSIHTLESEYFDNAGIVVQPLIEGTDVDKLIELKYLKARARILDAAVRKIDRRAMQISAHFFVELYTLHTFGLCYSLHQSEDAGDLYISCGDGGESVKITGTGRREACKNARPIWSPNGKWSPSYPTVMGNPCCILQTPKALPQGGLQTLRYSRQWEAFAGQGTDTRYSFRPAQGRVGRYIE
jgi:hypothetical protein